MLCCALSLVLLPQRSCDLAAPADWTNAGKDDSAVAAVTQLIYSHSHKRAHRTSVWAYTIAAKYVLSCKLYGSVQKTLLKSLCYAISAISLSGFVEQ